MTATSVSSAIPIGPQERLVLEPVAPFAPPPFREIWRFRDLLFTLAGRDLKVRYKQTALGLAWIVLTPLLGAFILTFVFARIAKVQAPGKTPYFLLAFSGMVVWTAFSSTLSRTASALVGNTQLVSKVYFPRLILPLSTVVSTLVDVAVMFALLVVMCAVYRWTPPVAVVFAPLFVALAMVLGSGMGTLLAGLAVKYRDVQYLLPVMTQMLLFASPVAYATTNVSSHRAIYFLNPLAGIIEGFRRCLLGVGHLTPGGVAYVVVASLAALAVGWLAFQRLERTFADVI